MDGAKQNYKDILNLAVAELIRTAEREACAAEIDACAEAAERYGVSFGAHPLRQIAARIRARK